MSPMATDEGALIFVAAELGTTPWTMLAIATSPAATPTVTFRTALDLNGTSKYLLDTIDTPPCNKNRQCDTGVCQILQDQFMTIKCPVELANSCSALWPAQM